MSAWLPADGGDRDDRRTRRHLRAGSAADVAEMLALVERTRPGPFSQRTGQLGTLPRRARRLRDGKPVAMAGERLHPAGYTELSAVCTDVARPWRECDPAPRAMRSGIGAREETPDPARARGLNNHSARSACTKRWDSRPGRVRDAHRASAALISPTIESSPSASASTVRVATKINRSRRHACFEHGATPSDRAIGPWSPWRRADEGSMVAPAVSSAGRRRLRREHGGSQVHRRADTSAADERGSNGRRRRPDDRIVYRSPKGVDQRLRLARCNVGALTAASISASVLGSPSRDVRCRRTGAPAGPRGAFPQSSCPRP